VAKKTKTTVTYLPITQARINLGRIARRVRVNKEYFILEKDGIPVVGIMDADEMEDYLELHDPGVQRQIEQSNAEIRAGRVRPASDFLAELQQSKAKKQARLKRSA